MLTGTRDCYISRGSLPRVTLTAGWFNCRSFLDELLAQCSNKSTRKPQRISGMPTLLLSIETGVCYTFPDTLELR